MATFTLHVHSREGWVKYRSSKKYEETENFVRDWLSKAERRFNTISPIYSEESNYCHVSTTNIRTDVYITETSPDGAYILLFCLQTTPVSVSINNKIISEKKRYMTYAIQVESALQISVTLKDFDIDKYYNNICDKYAGRSRVLKYI